MYRYFLAAHIVFVVSWMAGLFYIVRLFIYHTEANDRPIAERDILQDQFKMMETRLMNIITTPAMVLSAIAGIYMMYLNPGLLRTDWMWVKIAFVIGLVLYHLFCIRIINQLKSNFFLMSSTQLRLWNELATIFLVTIVFTVILKNAIDWIYGLIGIVLFSAVIMIAVKIYKYYRLKG